MPSSTRALLPATVLRGHCIILTKGDCMVSWICVYFPNKSACLLVIVDYLLHMICCLRIGKQYCCNPSHGQDSNNDAKIAIIP